MTRIGWKVFTVAAIAFDGAGIVSGSPRDAITALLNIMVLVGLVGYSWSLAIGPRWIWKMTFCLETLALAAAALLVLPILSRSRSAWPGFFVGALLLGTGMSLAKLYGLYRYGFSNTAPWSAVQPAAAAARG